MSDQMVIQSHAGPYTVHFDAGPAFDESRILLEGAHYLVDANVARLHVDVLRGVLAHPNTILIEATEENKSLQRTIPVFERLVAQQVRRRQSLVAIGGGIVQDITCFIASTVLRGIPWRFVPTTLLAQGDSCIGSKSSINLGSAKNIIGTFYPPQEVIINPRFLDTLSVQEMRSGIGELLKVHVIDGAASFDRLAADFDQLLTDRAVLLRYIRAALLVKQRFIEVDEFDRGVRNVFNYGHSFGHAIESATHYGIPHGIAVSIGMDMANHIAADRGVLPRRHAERMHGPLRKNYEEFRRTPIPREAMLDALRKDKKNTQTQLGLIFASGEQAEVQRVQVPLDDDFRAQCARFLDGLPA